jgi:excisionase family DNA binding protein
MTQLIGYDEAATVLRVHPGTLRRWASEGRVPHIKLGRVVRFDPAVLQRWIDERAVAEARR